MRRCRNCRRAWRSICSRPAELRARRSCRSCAIATRLWSGPASSVPMRHRIDTSPRWPGPDDQELPMLPPRLVRRLVLAPLAVVTWLFGLVGRSKPGRHRALRLLFFALVWLFADTSAVFMGLGLWIASGFGGRLRTEPFQSRHYAVMRWFLDRVYAAATRAFGLRIKIEEPEL